MGVATSRDLISALDEHRPDAIILDLRLAGTGGIAAADYIRRTPAGRNAPIIFLARMSNDLEREAASEYGPIVDEPLHAPAFCALVRDLVNEHRDILASNTVRLGGPKLLHA